jgi:hypothetical protein
MKRNLPATAQLLYQAARTYPSSAAVALNAGSVAAEICELDSSKTFLLRAVELAPTWKMAKDAVSWMPLQEERQGLTLDHFLAQRKLILLDTLGA